MILHRGLRILTVNQIFMPPKIPPFQKFNLLHENLLASSVYLSTPCAFKSTRPKTYKLKANRSLLPFRENDKSEKCSRENDASGKSLVDLNRKCSLLLNPAEHADITNSRQASAPVDSKSLLVSTIGVPNAGKSTLVNQLIGSNVCPHSKKVHTTRENAIGILTKYSTQIIFQVTDLW